MGLPILADAHVHAPLPFHAVLIDEQYAEGRSFGATLAARGATVHAVPDGDVTALWLHNIAPAWRHSPVPIAGLTRPPVLFCLEQLAWAQGLRVVFHAEHVIAQGRPVEHTVYQCSQGGLGLAVGDLASRGPLWPGQLADVVAAHGALTRHGPVGPSCAGLAPQFAADAVLLTSWIIGPV
jgi:hypothetical protein